LGGSSNTFFPRKEALDANQLLYGYGTQIIDENEQIDAGIKMALKNSQKYKEDMFL